MNQPHRLLAHWPLQDHLEDAGPGTLVTESHGVKLVEAQPGAPGGAARAASFDGKSAFLNVTGHPSLQLGKNDFSVEAWVYTDEMNTDIVGDIVSCFDPEARRGWGLSVVTNGGVTFTSQANVRHVNFGIDNGYLENGWTDHGRVGHASNIAALHASEGKLFAGTFEYGEEETGGLYLFEGGEKWTCLGKPPEQCNSVESIARYQGEMYVSTGRYNSLGSHMGPILNPRPGGNVYRINADGSWEDAGHPGLEDAVSEEADTGPGYDSEKADEACGLTVFKGKLFVVSYHQTNIYKYEGGQKWKNVGFGLRSFSLCIYQGNLYALTKGGAVYRFEDDGHWTHCGRPGTSTQTYGSMVVDGQFFVGTWPEGEVFRYEGGENWSLVARVGCEREVMAMVSYNQKGYVGSLPMAHVWRKDGDQFTLVGNVDNTREAYLRRAWSMAVYQGRLYTGTLPSGHVMSIQAGALATTDRSLPGGWRHIAGVKQDDQLKIYIDGKPTVSSTPFNREAFDLTNGQPLRIGFGGHTYFNGQMLDVRLYGRALDERDIQALVGD